jgi:N-acetylated-alpha-linked acidic dipeptidase
LIVVTALFIFAPHHHPHHRHSSKVSFKELQDILLNTPKEEKAQEWSRYYTSGPHLAGKNYSQAVWTQERWEEFGVKADIVAYDTYINYFAGHRLALYEKNRVASIDTPSIVDTLKVKYEASLEEDVLEEDPTSGLENRVPTYHGYSASGNVTAPYVYVNYGHYQDYEDLLKANVSLEGKIAIARYGGIFRGLKIKRAQELGMVGVVLFTDPGDDKDITEEKGIDVYPNGPARQPSSVQRGSTQFLSFGPGDP